MASSHFEDVDDRLISVAGKLDALLLLLSLRLDEKKPNLEGATIAVRNLSTAVQELIQTTNKVHTEASSKAAQQGARCAFEATLGSLRVSTLRLITLMKSAVESTSIAQAWSDLQSGRDDVAACLSDSFEEICAAYRELPLRGVYPSVRQTIAGVDGFLASGLSDTTGRLESDCILVNDWLVTRVVVSLERLAKDLEPSVRDHLVELKSAFVAGIDAVYEVAAEGAAEQLQEAGGALRTFLAALRPNEIAPSSPKLPAAELKRAELMKTQHSFTTAIKRAGGGTLVLPGFNRGSNALAAQRLKPKKKVLDTTNAETVVELFMEHFVDLQDLWLVQTEAEKATYLQTLASELEAQRAAAPVVESGNRLEDIIKSRCDADLERALHGSSEGEMSMTTSKLAESVLHVIEHSSVSLVEGAEEPALGNSVSMLFSVLIETLKRLDVRSVIGADVVQRSVEQVVEMLDDKSHSDDFCVIDERVVKAAEGHGSKLIVFQMKADVWDECNSLRILAGCLLCSLDTVSNPSSVTAGVLHQIASGARCIVAVLQRLLCKVVTAKHIMSKGETSLLSQSSGSNATVACSIWDEHRTEEFLWEAEDSASSSVSIRAGTLNKLIQVLTSEENLDNTLLKTFITTYRSFTTPWVLLEKLIERFDVPKDKVTDEKRVFAIQLRVAVTVKYWVDTQFYDFDEDLLQRLLAFTATALPDAGHNDMGKLLTQMITSKVEERKKKQDAVISIPPTDLTIPGVSTMSQLFLNLSEEEFARQLTLVDAAIYRNIKVSELLQGAWNSDKLKHRSPNVCKLLDRLNKVTMFVPTLVLWQTRKADRARVFEKMIRVGQHLKTMQNYNSLMGIVAGLNLSCLTRLKVTMAEVDPKVLQQFSTLEKLMDPSSSFKNYRKAFQNCKLPALPYLGVYLTDLTFLEDGNPDTVAHSKHPEAQLINFQKRAMVYKVLQQLQVYQQGQFPFPVLEPVHTLLVEMTHETEKTLYNLSLAHEPRNADPKTII